VTIYIIKEVGFNPACHRFSGGKNTAENHDTQNIEQYFNDQILWINQFFLSENFTLLSLLRSYHIGNIQADVLKIIITQNKQKLMSQSVKTS